MSSTSNSYGIREPPSSNKAFINNWESSTKKALSTSISNANFSTLATTKADSLRKRGNSQSLTISIPDSYYKFN